MSNALKYQDLSPTEQLAYKRLVGQGQSSGERTSCDGETTHDKSQPARRRPFLASATSLGSYVASLFQRDRRTLHATTGWSALEQFIRMQAANRGCEGFDRDSFPNFPAEVEPFARPSGIETDKAEQDYPEALHDIIEAFCDATPAQHLEMLMAYAGHLPELPEELHNSRDTMEQVDECMTPVFLSAQLRDGRVYYHIDVPSDAPTMRGFAGLLYVGLNGAAPTAIAATPGDLCQQLGLQKALGAPRSRGLTALLRRMQRNAVDLARTT
jgi:cysteine desulfuration protein SufE